MGVERALSETRCNGDSNRRARKLGLGRLYVPSHDTGSFRFFFFVSRFNEPELVSIRSLNLLSLEKNSYLMLP